MKTWLTYDRLSTHDWQIVSENACTVYDGADRPCLHAIAQMAVCGSPNHWWRRAPKRNLCGSVNGDNYPLASGQRKVLRMAGCWNIDTNS
jgi:hypothetical protein